MENYKGINQKGLAFIGGKTKELQKRKKTKKIL